MSGEPALPPPLPSRARDLLRAAVSRLSVVDGVEAIVLGGSWARGTARPDSDLDLGLYYRDEFPFEIERIREVARDLSVAAAPVVTGFYEWGPWVNGGAWIPTGSHKIDLIFRSADHVERVIEESIRGIARSHYEQQPAYGFYSVIYLGETASCIPLEDPAGLVAGLKRRVLTYPPALRDTILRDSLWSAEFTLMFASGYAERGDVVNTVGCLTRIAGALTQALFALNETYFVSEKEAPERLRGFPRRPPDCDAILRRVLSAPGSESKQLCTSVDAIAGLWRSLLRLPGVDYEPRYPLAAVGSDGLRAGENED